MDSTPLICQCNPRPKSLGVTDTLVDVSLDGVDYLLHLDCQDEEVKNIVLEQAFKQFPEAFESEGESECDS